MFVFLCVIDKLMLIRRNTKYKKITETVLYKRKAWEIELPDIKTYFIKLIFKTM
jgi:hypothetical protein